MQQSAGEVHHLEPFASQTGRMRCGIAGGAAAAAESTLDQRLRIQQHSLSGARVERISIIVRAAAASSRIVIRATTHIDMHARKVSVLRRFDSIIDQMAQNYGA